MQIISGSNLMSEYQAVAKVGDIPEGEGRTYPVNGQMVGVFFVDGEYYAINDFCPHQGASLSAGYAEAGSVTCPWHAWRFSLKDGHWEDAPGSSVRCTTYQLRIENDDIEVLVPDIETKTSENAD